MSRIRSPLPSTVDVVFVLWALMAPLAMYVGLLSSDGDVARHLRLGERMLATGRLVERDFFSFTRAGEPFVAFEWGSEVVYALAHRIGGLPAVAILAGLLIAITYAGVVLFLRRSGVDPFLTYVVAMTASVLGMIHWLARPHLFTFVLTVVLLHLLESRGGRRVWLFAPLFVVWANLHGGFVYGFVLIGIYLAGDVLEAWRGDDRGAWLERARFHAGGLGLAMGASLVNPNGPGLFTHVWEIVTGANGLDYIKSNTVEFQSPNFHTFDGKVFLLALLALLAALVVTRTRPSYPRLLLFLASVAFALDAVRNIPLFAITALPVIVVSLDAEWRRLRLPGLDRVREAFVVGDRGTRVGLWIAPAVLALALLAASRGRVGKTVLIPDEFDRGRFPAAAVERARAEGVSGRMFSEFTWGGYLLHAWPEQKVFIDGGTDFYGEEVFRDFGQVVKLEPGWRDVLDRWEIELALLAPDSRLAAELSRDPAWTTWHADSTAVLLRRVPADAPLALPAVSSPRRPDPAGLASEQDAARARDGGTIARSPST